MKYPEPQSLKVLVEPIERKDELIGKIIMPGVANANLDKGKIVAFDPFLKEVYNIGDTVLFHSGVGLSYMIEGKAYLWLQGALPGQHGEIWAIDNGE